MNPNKQFTSGRYSASGASFSSSPYVSSGVPLSSGVSDSQFFIGDDIDTRAPTAFRLAPRLYNLSREVDGQQPLSGIAASALAGLPIQLAFREMVADEHSRQCWARDTVNRWQFQLVVEQNNGSLRVTLTAAGGPNGQQLVWRPQAVWEPFGTNTLHPGPDTILPRLLVKAP